jgi:hypothetical protein
MSAAALAVALALARVDKLVAQEPGKDARAVAALDRRAAAAYKDIAPLGGAAAAPLADAALDLKRAPKTRFFAVTFLARLGAPACYPPLASVFLDPGQDDESRLAAAQGLSAVDAPRAAVSRTFCAALAQPDLPRPLLDTTLIALTRGGCADPAPLDRAARAYGPRPGGADLVDVRRAMEALARSRGPAPLRRLLALALYFPSRGEARAAAVVILETRKAELVKLAPESLPAVRELIRSETAETPSMLILIRLADAFGPESNGLLVPLASHPDAEVLADAAEALARRKAVAALPALEKTLAGAIDDPRFAPKPGRPDPAKLLARIDAAAQVLRAARDSKK